MAAKKIDVADVKELVRVNKALAKENVKLKKYLDKIDAVLNKATGA